MTAGKAKTRTVPSRKPRRPAKQRLTGGRPRRSDRAASKRNLLNSRTVSAADAPIEAWRQAMVPKLEEIADGMGASGALKRAIVFMTLLQFKPDEDIEVFKGWAYQVTRYYKREITEFAARGARGFLIVDGRPNLAAFENDLAGARAEGGEEVAVILLANVFVGKLCRDANGQYSLPDQST